MNIVGTPALTATCQRLREVVGNRRGTIVLGAPCAGKSTVIQLVSQASHAALCRLNPYAFPAEQLYGATHPTTQQWTDGVVPNILRAAGHSSLWLVFDGYLDSGWAEGLNPALDESSVLTLPSGERIVLHEDIKYGQLGDWVTV